MSRALLLSCNPFFDHLRRLSSVKLIDCMHDVVPLAFSAVRGGTANGGKPPIILLHGMMSAKESWQDVIHPIAEATSCKVYAFDARNHGNSGWSENFAIEYMKRDLLLFMDCIASQKAILIGHSMGGMIAMNFATTWPERVDKLITEDVSPEPVSKHLKDNIVKYVQWVQVSIEKIPANVTDLQEAKNFVYELLNGNKSQDDPRRQNTNKGSSLPLYEDKNGQFKWKINFKVLDKYLQTIHLPRRVTGLYPGPMLVLYGTLSPYKVYDDRDYIKRVFPKAQLRAIEGASHQIHEEHAYAFVKEVVDFIMKS